MDLKTILAIKEADLSVEQKGVVTANWDILNDELRAKFASCKPAEAKEDKGIDEETLKGLISQSTQEHIAAKAEAIAKSLVDKFAQSFEAQKKIVAETGTKLGKKENDEVTRKFLKAMIAKDTKTLKELGQKVIDTSSDGSGADAGFTIPEPLANEVIRLESVGYGIARQLFAYNLLTVGNTKRVTALGSTLSVFWTDEGEKKGASQPTFDLITLALKKLTVIVPFTEESIEDSGVDLTGLVATLIREAIDKEVDLQFFMGDGTVWTGIFKDTSLPTDELPAGDTGADLSPEAIVALADNTPLGVNGAYLMHRTVLSKIKLIKDDDGRYLYNPLASGPLGTVNGYQVILSESAPTYASTISGVNKPIMMFGDFKRAFAYGEKSDIRLKMLDQATITDVDGETVLNLAEQDMIALRAVQRVGYKATLKTAVRRLVSGDAS